MYERRKLSDGERERWLHVIWLEAVLLLILLVIVVVIVVVATEYIHERILTNTAVIILVSAVIGEFTRRVRALMKEYKHHA